MIGPFDEVNILVIDQSRRFGAYLIQELSDYDKSFGQSPKEQPIDIRNFIQTDNIKARILYFGNDLSDKCVYRFFLTEQTICIIIAEHLFADNQKYIDFWTKEIRRYSQSSIAIIFPNYNTKDTIDSYQIRNSLDANITYHILPELGNNKLAEFRLFLLKLMQTSISVNNSFPNWIKIREKLKENTKDLISVEEFHNICINEKVFDKDERQKIALWLHKTGAILAFLNDFRLQQHIVLNPQWIARAVNSLHSSNAIFTNHAILEPGMIDNYSILSEYNRIEEKIYIIDLMHKFDLCLEVESNDNQKRYLLPTLVDKEDKFVGDWVDPRIELSFEYSCYTLHIIPRITAKLYSYVKYHTHWQSGCLLFYGNNESARALIRSIPEKACVQVLIQGVDLKACNELGVLIQETINKLNTKLELNNQHNSLLYKVERKQDNTRLFISYAHKDKMFARKLANELEKAGMKVWWDFDSLKGGQDWQKEIERGIKQCDFFLVALTPDSIISEWVGNEITYASQAQKTIIPLHLKKCDVPISLVKKQYIDFEKQTQKSALKELIRILKQSSEI